MAKKTRSDAADLLKAISKQPSEAPQEPLQTVSDKKQAEPRKAPPKPAQAVPSPLEKRSKEQLNTTVDPDVKRAITLIQQDVQRVGAKKPKIGEIIETAIFELLKARGLSLD